MRAALLFGLLGCPPAGDDTGDADTADTADTAGTDVPFPDLARLTEYGGCADVVLDAHAVDDTVGMVLEAFDLGIARAACESGTQTMDITLPDARVALRVDAGEHVAHYVCNDAIEYEPVVETTWVATGGSLTIEVIPADTTYEDCEGWPYGSATLTLHDVVFESADGGETTTVETFGWSAMVGWLPG